MAQKPQDTALKQMKNKPSKCSWISIFQMYQEKNITSTSEALDDLNWPLE